MTIAVAGLDVHFELPRAIHQEASQRSLAFLKTAVEYANFPIFIYLVECYPGLLGRLAAGGYSCGQSIYATHLHYTSRFNDLALTKIQTEIFDRALKYSVPEYAIPDAIVNADNRRQSCLVTRCDQLQSRHRPGFRAIYSNNKARTLALPNYLK